MHACMHAREHAHAHTQCARAHSRVRVHVHVHVNGTCMSTSLHMCMHVHACACMCIVRCRGVCVYARSVCMRAYACAHAVRACVCMHAHVRTLCMYARLCQHVCTYVCIRRQAERMAAFKELVASLKPEEPEAEEAAEEAGKKRRKEKRDHRGRSEEEEDDERRHGTLVQSRPCLDCAWTAPCTRRRRRPVPPPFLARAASRATLRGALLSAGSGVRVHSRDQRPGRSAAPRGAARPAFGQSSLPGSNAQRGAPASPLCWQAQAQEGEAGARRPPRPRPRPEP